MGVPIPSKSDVDIPTGNLTVDLEENVDYRDRTIGSISTYKSECSAGLNSRTMTPPNPPQHNAAFKYECVVGVSILGAVLPHLGLYQPYAGV